MPGQIEYKGEMGLLLMTGTKEKVPGFSGEVFVAVIQYGPKESAKFDVIPDSTNPADLDDLPEVKTFTDRGSAINHFMMLDRNKRKWKG